MNAGPGPDFIHYYRVNFDGTGLIAFTRGTAIIRSNSADRKYLIDTYSRVDIRRRHKLRRVHPMEARCASWRRPTSPS